MNIIQIAGDKTLQCRHFGGYVVILRQFFADLVTCEKKLDMLIFHSLQRVLRCDLTGLRKLLSSSLKVVVQPLCVLYSRAIRRWKGL